MRSLQVMSVSIMYGKISLANKPHLITQLSEFVPPVQCYYVVIMRSNMHVPKDPQSYGKVLR